MNLNKEIRVIPYIMKKAFEEIVEDRFYSQNYEQYAKGNNDVVTDCDIEVEKYIIKQIKNEFPGDSFISEELNSKNELEERTWIIDPIDGTVNFSRGLKLFGIQIALVENNEPVFSAVYLPFWNEMYTAAKNQGAYLNGDRIYTSQIDKMIDGIVTFGDFSSRKKAENTRRNQIGVVNDIYNKVKKFKMFGASCIDFTALASSKTDVHIIFTKNLWDLLPGYLLAIEAGAKSNYDFNNPKEFVVVAANDYLLDAILNEIGDINE